MTTNPDQDTRLEGIPHIEKAGGDFWTSVLREEDRDLVRLLATLPSRSNMLCAMDAVAAKASGASRADVRDVDIVLAPNDVVSIGPDMLAGVSGPGDFTTLTITIDPPAADSQFVIKGSDHSVYIDKSEPEPGAPVTTVTGGHVIVARQAWLVLLPVELDPMVIRLGSRLLVRGSGFVAGTGWAVFYVQPIPETPGPWVLHVEHGYIRQKSLLGFPGKADNLFDRSGGHVIRYLRDQASPAMLGRALAEIAGLTVVPSDCVITDLVEIGSNWYDYIHADGRIEARYPHTPLTPGQALYAGDVIGDAVKVYHAGSSPDAWWNNVNWGDGIKLNGLCLFDGLTLPPGSVNVFARAASGPDLHAAPKYPADDYEVRDAFWEYLAKAELASGIFLNTAIGLTVEGEEAPVNMLDLVFRMSWGNRAVAVDVDVGTLGVTAAARVLAFARDEAPVGSVMLFGLHDATRRIWTGYFDADLLAEFN